MRNFLAYLFSLGPLILLSPGSSAGFLFSEEVLSLQRRSLPQEDLPEQVCRLSVGGGTLCSGVVISPTQILTALHCFYSDENLLPKKQPNGRAVISCPHTHKRGVRLKEVHYIEAPKNFWDFFTNRHSIDPGLDVAIVELGDPLDLPPIEVATSQEISELRDVPRSCAFFGYGGEGPLRGEWVDFLPPQHAEIYSIHKKFLPLRPSTISHGDSGGPLLCRVQGDWKVFGVITSILEISFQDGHPQHFSEPISYLESYRKNLARLRGLLKQHYGGSFFFSERHPLIDCLEQHDNSDPSLLLENCSLAMGELFTSFCPSTFQKSPLCPGDQEYFFRGPGVVTPFSVEEGRRIFRMADE